MSEELKNADLVSGDKESQAIEDLVNEYGRVEVIEQAEIIPGDTVGIPFPDISPVAISLGPLELRWYSMAYLIGILFGWYFIAYLNRKHGGKILSDKAVEALPMWMIISIIIGGRLGYVLFYNFEYYINNLSETYKIWMGGMSFHGGLLGVIIGTYLFARKYKVKFLQVTDYLAVVSPVGIFFGRIANFINQELYGKYTDVWWGVIFKGDVKARHPSQLYEAVLEGVMIFVALYIIVAIYNGLKRVGLASGLFLILYGISRIIVEFFRMPDEQIGYLLGTDWMTMGQVLSLPLLLIGAWIIVRGKRIIS
jgi:phosphatidylglycerol:prolipoprotein diacylglycerol transferase